MVFSTINGYTVTQINETPKRSIKSKGGRRRSARGEMRDSRRGNRRAWSGLSKFEAFKVSDALEHLIHGEAHVFSFADGLQGSTGLEPEYGAQGVAFDLSTTGLNGSAGGVLTMREDAVSGVPARLEYNPQFDDDAWTILWHQHDGADWVGFALRSDGHGYTAGARDDASVAAAQLGVRVLNGRVILTNTDNTTDLPIDQLVLLPWYASNDMLETWTAIVDEEAWGPAPVLKLKGDVIAEGIAYVVGEVTESVFVQRSNGLATFNESGRRTSGVLEDWRNNDKELLFNLVEVPDAYVKDFEFVAERKPLPPTGIADELGRFIEATRFRGNYVAGSVDATNPITLTPASAGLDNVAIAKYGAGFEPDWAAHVDPLANSNIALVSTRTVQGGGMTVAAFHGQGASGQIDIYDGSTPSTPGGKFGSTLLTDGSSGDIGFIVGYNVDGSVAWVKQLGHTSSPTSVNTGWTPVHMSITPDGLTYIVVGLYTWNRIDEPDPLVDTLTHANVTGSASLNTGAFMLLGSVADGTVSKLVMDFLKNKVGRVLAEYRAVACPNNDGDFATSGFWEYSSNSDNPEPMNVDEDEATEIGLLSSNRSGRNNHTVKRLATGLRDWAVCTHDAANTSDDGRDTGCYIDAEGLVYRVGIVDPNTSVVREDERYPTALSSPTVQDGAVKFLIQCHEDNGDEKYQVQINSSVLSLIGNTVEVHVDEVNKRLYVVIAWEVGAAVTLTADPGGDDLTVTLSGSNRTALFVYDSTDGTFLDGRELENGAGGVDNILPVRAHTPRTGPFAGQLVLGLSGTWTVDRVVDIGDGITTIPRTTGEPAFGMLVATFDEDGGSLRALTLTKISSSTIAVLGSLSGHIQSLGTY